MNGEPVILVTGVSSGIGEAIAALLAERKFRVFGTQRRPSEDERVPHNVELVPLDVRDEQSVRSALQIVLDRAGRIDAVINNAGYTLVGALEETSIDEAKALFETNFFGVLRMNQAVLPVMRKQGQGRIINIGSATGFVPAPYQGIYSASKHALEGYSESLDHEVRQFGIRVSVVEPGFTRTHIDQNAELASELIPAYANDRGQVIASVKVNNANGKDPAEVALVVWKALTARSPRLVYLAGSDARLVSRLKKFAPSGLFDKGLRKQFGLAGA